MESIHQLSYWQLLTAFIIGSGLLYLGITTQPEETTKEMLRVGSNSRYKIHFTLVGVLAVSFSVIFAFVKILS